MDTPADVRVAAAVPSLDAESALAMPKSVTTAERPVRSTFPGLMSR